MHCQKNLQEAAAQVQARLIVQLKDNQPSHAVAVSRQPLWRFPAAHQQRHLGLQPARNRHETRSADVFSATRSVAATEPRPTIKSTPLRRHPRGLASRCQDRPLEQHLRGRILTWPILPYRRASPPPQSGTIWNVAEHTALTLVTSLSRKINPASVVTRVSSCGCAASPTMCYAVTEPAPSVRTDTPPLSLVSVPWPTGASVESI